MKKLLTERDVDALFKMGSKSINVTKDVLITSLALDRAKSLGLNIEYGIQYKKESSTKNTSDAWVFTKVAIGSDHTGFSAKLEVIKYLSSIGVMCTDVGCISEESCDYPDFAILVSQKVLRKEVDAGIILDATGIPSCITSNKFRGIRSATCYNEFSALSARSHNNSNIICLGAKTLGIETIKSILKVWLSTSFEGGRHQKRLDKITAIEK